MRSDTLFKGGSFCVLGPCQFTSALSELEWGFPVAGQVYHFLIAGALMAPYQNATEKYDKNALFSVLPPCLHASVVKRIWAR
jgi:hypothetical protein